MKQTLFIVMTFLAAVAVFSHAEAAPYGPTLDEVAQKYAATRNFDKLKDNLSKEQIPIRLGMTKDDVERWAAHSAIYTITSRKDSIYKFAQKDYEPFSLSFDVWFAKGVVAVIKTYNINNFEAEDNELKQLKALRPVRTNECWVRQNYVDTDSYANGYDFALMIERGIPQDDKAPCMGSDRANITIGKPGTLYPKHVSPMPR